MKDRKLIIKEPEASLVRSIFERFARIGSGTKLAEELLKEGAVNRYGKPIDKGALYKLLNNRVYIGEAVHKGTSYPGEHKAIIDKALWDKVHAILAQNARQRAGRTRRQTPALLQGLIFGPTGHAMSPSHTRRRGRLYRYYVSQAVLKGQAGSCPVRRVPAADVERAVIDQIRILVAQPEIVVTTWRAARSESASITEADVRNALHQLELVWEELFPAEQARIVRLMVERVDIGEDGLDVQLKVGGLVGLVGELGVGCA